MSALPVCPQLSLSFSILNQSVVFFMKFSSLIVHPKATEGKYPHLWFFVNTLAPSERKVAVNK